MPISEKRIMQLKEIIPSLWNSYQHMYDIRLTSTQNKTGFLLTILSFLSAVSISLFAYFDNALFLLPFLLQITSFVILLKIFFIKNLMLHWFESNSLFKNLERNEFHQDLFADLKALEGDTYTYLVETSRISKISLSLILFSLYSILLTLLFIYFKDTDLYLLVLALTILSILIVCVYYKKQPNFNYESSYKEYRKKIDEWVKGN